MRSRRSSEPANFSTRATVLLLGVMGVAAAAGTDLQYREIKSFGFTDLVGGSPVTPLVPGGNGTLYGTTVGGPNGGRDTIFKLNQDGSGYHVLRIFSTGNTPWAPVTGTDGVFYGTTMSGGTNSYGTIFQINNDGSGYSVLHDFASDGSDGYDPRAGLVEGTDGALYGTTGRGGSNDVGTVFKVNKDGNDYKVLHSFGNTTNNDQFPWAGLIEGNDGALYGTCYSGPFFFGGGAVFKLNKDGSGYVVLHTFGRTPGEGQHSVAALVLASDGALYGTTQNGGAHADAGTVFRLNPDGSGYAVLYNFGATGSDGRNPGASLAEGTDGFLYGTTLNGGGNNAGTVFRIARTGTDYAVLHSCASTSDDGRSPWAGLALGTDGALYGTASLGGGSNNLGAVFKLNTDGSGYHVVHSFSGTGGDGQQPRAVVEASDGGLYGTTSQGGSNNLGTVFGLKKDGSDYSLLHSFGVGAADGQNPIPGVIEGSDGALYGTTDAGGSNNLGTVFKLNKDGGAYFVIHHFTGNDGQHPAGVLMQGTDGALYGTAYSGGSNQFGTVFKLNTDGTEFRTLRSFSASEDGWLPIAGLLEGSDGALYGTTLNGGSNDNGTVFKLNKDGSDYAVLHYFSGNYIDGSYVQTVLMQGSHGALYGTTELGGSNGQGTVFTLNLDGSGYRVLHHFGVSPGDGQLPSSGLAEGNDQALYGTTGGGGSTAGPNSGGYGTAFRITQDGASYDILYNFTFTNQSPVGVIPARDGAFYGGVAYGGELGLGAIFQLSAANLPPIPVITLSPLAHLPGQTNPIVIARDNRGAPVEFDGTKSFDPEHAALNYFWYEGTNLFSTNAVASGVMTVGPHRVRLVVSDGQDSGTAQVSFEVITAADAVERLIAAVNASGERSRPLDASLTAALKSLEQGHPRPAIHQLEAFQHKVQAQLSPHNPDLAQALLQAAQDIIDGLIQS
jgi:uncharacterized repeat protein (TIGR03803 family)